MDKIHRGPYYVRMNTRQLEKTFRDARKKWKGNGSGSTPEKTGKLLTELKALLSELNVKSVMDFGCGDVTWMAPLASAGGYCGVDVVPEVIEANALKHPSAVFLALTEDVQLPRCDLIFCRDVLAHLSHATALAVLERLKRTGATWLLCSNYYGSGNTSIKDGGFRPLNLQRLPFHFPEPLKVIDEGFEKKSMALWRFDRVLPGVEVPLAPAE